MKFKVKKDIRGYESLVTLNAFGRLVLFVCNAEPTLAHLDLSMLYEELGQMTDVEKEELIRKAVFLHQLERDEFHCILKFINDENGIAVSERMARTMTPNDLHELICQVFIELSNFRVSLIVDDEKKNCPTSQLM